MNGHFLCLAIFCSIALFVYAQDSNDNDQNIMEKRFRQFAFAKRARNFAFAKRFDALGYNSFAKRSPLEDGPIVAIDEQLSEPEKRARFAFAKRARFAFA